MTKPRYFLRFITTGNYTKEYSSLEAAETAAVEANATLAIETASGDILASYDPLNGMTRYYEREF